MPALWGLCPVGRETVLHVLKMCLMWPLCIKTLQFDSIIRWHLWANTVSACREEESERIWSTGTRRRTMTVGPTCKQSCACVCVCVRACVCLNTYPSVVMCPSYKSRKKESEARWRWKGGGLFSTVCHFSFLRFIRERNRAGGLLLEGCGHGVEKNSNREEDVLWPRSCSVYICVSVCVCVCGWTLSSVSRKRGGPSEGWTGNSNRAYFL